MRRTFISLLIFINSNCIFAQEKTSSPVLKIQAGKEIPLELNFIIEFLENTLGHEKVLPLILNIDSYARALTREDVLIIGKIEIYKTLLRGTETFPKAIVDGNTIQILKEAIKKTSDPFVKWFYQALLRDCETLLETQIFKEYLLQKSNGQSLRVELKKIDKKVQLIYRWISKINPEASDFQELFKVYLTPVLMNILINIEESFFLMALASAPNSLPQLIKSPSELKFFSLKEIKISPKPVIREKSVEDILAPVLPKSTSEEWSPKEGAIIDPKNLPKPTDDADWLQDF